MLRRRASGQARSSPSSSSGAPSASSGLPSLPYPMLYARTPGFPYDHSLGARVVASVFVRVVPRMPLMLQCFGSDRLRWHFVCMNTAYYWKLCSVQCRCMLHSRSSAALEENVSGLSLSCDRPRIISRRYRTAPAPRPRPQSLISSSEKTELPCLCRDGSGEFSARERSGIL